MSPEVASSLLASAAPQASSKASKLSLVLLIVVLCVAIWFRSPRTQEGLPYFYREDEAHHFNRIAEMVKEGRLDPVYFHKPSLHFYLRMPILGASFLWGVREGHLRSVQEITTRDRYGIAGYSFTTSHTGIVKANRWFSVGLVLVSIVLSAHLALLLSGSTLAAISAAALLALSPALIAESAVIGVDVVMMTMCLWCTWIAVYFSAQGSIKPAPHGASADCRAPTCSSYAPLLGSAFVAGLAISSKYNALPIVVVPLLFSVWHFCFSLRALALTCGAIVAGFLFASPYILAHIPLFLDHVAYEVWHYGVAGHVGHMANPGMEQVLFYARWLLTDGFGPVAALLGIAGMLGLLRPRFSREILFLAFPLLFFGLMISQKTNFTRNMLPLLPYVAVAAGYALTRGLEALWSNPRLQANLSIRYLLAATMCAIVFAPPFLQSLSERQLLVTAVDSRERLQDHLRVHEQSFPTEQVAISGQLQLPQSFFAVGPRARFDQRKESLLSLYQRGFTLFATLPSLAQPADASLPREQVQEFPGFPEAQRIIKNPRIVLERLVEGEMLNTSLETAAKNDSSSVISVTLADREPKNCVSAGTTTSDAEGYCWLGRRVGRLALTDLSAELRADPNAPYITLALEARSPWQDNELKFWLGGWEASVSLPLNDWTPVVLRLPLKELLSSGEIFISSKTVRTPNLQGLSEDPRPLGVALRHIQLR